MQCESMDNTLIRKTEMEIFEQYSYLFNGKWNPQTIDYLNNENVNP
jgi:hypothetical protein